MLDYFPTALLSLHLGISNVEQSSGLSYLDELAEDGFESKVLPWSAMLTFSDN